MKTKLEIIEETVQYYSEDTSRRAVNETGGCSYYDSDTGNMCAVGRYLKNPIGVFGRTFTDILLDLKEEYKCQESCFWSDLQKLHDEHSYWNEEGLTEDGQQYVHELKEEYA